ncbi:T9SS type A sorting domain-containing protein, partial [Flavobacteriales bacterium]|nr:T9SS type A sorting domain-containing protein [Flavobacteriales bacterium]
FMDFNTAGAQDTFYFDDVMFLVSPPATLSQIDLPVTFEDTTVDYTMTDFGGNASALSIDPTNAANMAMCVIKTTGAQTWAGTTIGTATGFANAIPFTATDQKMTVRVWSATAGTPIRLKVEDATNVTHTCETEALTVTAGGWDTLTFDFANPATGTATLNLTYTFDKASIFFDFNTAGAQDTFYFDDVMFLPAPPAALSQIDLPVTFEDTTVDYTMTSFGGNTDSLTVDPTNAANMVMCVVKTTGAQTWAGTTIGTPSGFASAIPFTATDQKMTVRVWSAAAGTPIRLKVEDVANAAISCETEALTVTAGGWDTLTFDFANPASGTAALNLANTYDKASIFFDFGTAGAQDTFYFDDVMFGGDTTTPGPSLAQIDLTVNFEDTAVDYTMTDFGGNASMLMIDPTNSGNKVMQVIKTTGAQTWAGTTIGTASGFANAIPFTATDQKMTVRVWSAAAGLPIRLKVEDATNATISCETEALTVTAGGWDTLTFDFANPAAGTAALNIANTYDKASIFFDFNTAGAQDTFYFDDVAFGGYNVSINENGVQNLSIYPNPTSNQWTIDSEDNEILSIEIYGIQGALIFSETANSKKVRVDASNYVPGMYILKATTTNGIVSKRVFKN